TYDTVYQLPDIANASSRKDFTISSPPPRHSPSTAQITGFFPRRLLNPPNPPGGWWRITPFAFASSHSFRSCPAQNARGRFIPGGGADEASMAARRLGVLSYHSQ